MGRPLTNPWRRALRMTGLVVLAIAASAAAVLLLLPLAIRGFVRVLDLTLNACVWLAASISNGADGWTILAAIGREAGSMLLGTRAVRACGTIDVGSAQ